MAQIRPFCSVRPAENAAARVAALPYDVYDYEEAKREVLREPLSFLRIDRAETLMPEGTDPYSTPVYETARDEIARFCREGVLITEEKPCYYLYELTGMGHTQTGIVGLSSVDDYLNGIVRRHENTRADKEQDRIRHVDVTDMQTGPIFLACATECSASPGRSRFGRLRRHLPQCLGLISRTDITEPPLR